MLFNRMLGFVSVACFCGLISWGCVERSEWITIAQDGSATLRIRYEAPEQELQGGDAMPSEASGWAIERSTKKENDKTKVILEGEKYSRPGEAMTSTFAALSDPDSDLYLSFPTTLRIEHRSDGDYYYFRRTYTPRRWAYVQHWQDVFFDDDDVKKLSDKAPEDLTLAERSRIVEAFTGFEAFKQLELAMAAIEQSLPTLAVEHGLMARQALINHYENKLEVSEKDGVRSGPIVEAIVACERLDPKGKEACIEQESQRILDAGLTAFADSLRIGAALNEDQLRRFDAAYDRAEREYAVTDALAGHAFEIDVRMPGTIIAHNAIDGELKIEEDSSRIQFHFDGKAFRDRKHELIVVSKVEAGNRRLQGDRSHDGSR